MMSAHRTRHILDVVSTSEADPDITVVRTGAQLQAAVMDGAQDILIQEHLDLSDLNLAFNANHSRDRTTLGEVKPATRSIRVFSLTSSCCGIACRSSVAKTFKRLHLAAASRVDMCHVQCCVTLRPVQPRIN